MCVEQKWVKLCIPTVFLPFASLAEMTAKVMKLNDKNQELLGNSGRVVNSLDFCLASLKSLGCFYFWCVLSSQWKVVTVNL